MSESYLVVFELNKTPWNDPFIQRVTKGDISKIVTYGSVENGRKVIL